MDELIFNLDQIESIKVYREKARDDMEFERWRKFLIWETKQGVYYKGFYIGDGKYGRYVARNGRVFERANLTIKLKSGDIVTRFFNSNHEMDLVVDSYRQKPNFASIPKEFL